MRARRFLWLGSLLFAAATASYAQDNPTPVPTPSTAQNAPIVIGYPLFEQGGTALEAEDYTQALLNFSLFSYLNPTSSHGYYVQALAFLGVEEPEQAVEQLTLALTYATEATPQYLAEVYALRADLQAGAEDYEAAIADYSAAIEATPSVDFYASRALLYVQTEAYDAALADYDAAIALEENPGLYVGRALVHQAANDLEAARADFDQAVTLAPQEPVIRLYRAGVLNQLGEAAEAAVDYLSYVILSSPDGTPNVEELGQLRSGVPEAVTMSENAIFQWQFTVQKNDVVNARTSVRPGDQVDPLIVILDEAGNPLIASDDVGVDLNAAIEDFVAPSTGDYFLVLSHVTGGSEGEVGVLVEVNAEDS